MIRWLQTPQQRRQARVLGSGALIAAGWLSGRLGQPGLYQAFMVAAALLAGSEIARRAFASLRNRHISIELLVTIATAGALWIGETWEAAAVTFLFVLGSTLEARTLSRTRQVLGELLDLAPTTATVVRDGKQVEVLPDEVEPDEIVWIKPGGKVPVDGEVAEGQSSVDESAITGEPMPEFKEAGAYVYAGTVNQEGLLKVRATGVGADTTLARIIRRVEEAQDAKAPIQRFIERFAKWYTPAILVLSAGVYLLTRDVDLALTLLVISCPGALVISTPVSIVAGIGRAAKRGILIKGGEYLENAGKISAVALDKTGTLTQGKPEVTDIILPAGAEVYTWTEIAAPVETVSLSVGAREGKFDGPAYSDRLNGAAVPTTWNTSRWNPGQQEVLLWAAAAEAGSQHPLARAILAAAEETGVTVPPIENFENFTGRGIRATSQGQVVTVGSPAFLEEQGFAVDAALEAEAARLKGQGKTALLVALDERVLGVLGVADPLRESAAEMVRAIRASGVKRIVMLTGDDRRTAEAIGKAAGIEEIQAELLPEDKLNAIRKLQAEGHIVAMTGDGINDAPALAAADLGVAMAGARRESGGSDIAIETADIALLSDDLMKIPEAIRLSKATVRNIRQNVLVALVTVTALILGVLFGRVHMASGMLVHEVSVLIVILNGMRLLRA